MKRCFVPVCMVEEASHPRSTNPQSSCYRHAFGSQSLVTSALVIHSIPNQRCVPRRGNSESPVYPPLCLVMGWQLPPDRDALNQWHISRRWRGRGMPHTSASTPTNWSVSDVVASCCRRASTSTRRRTITMPSADHEMIWAWWDGRDMTGSESVSETMLSWWRPMLNVPRSSMCSAGTEG